ncbi:unnamed protein product [Boreogadus saida]
MDEEREEGGPTSKTALSGEHGRRSKAKSPEQQERADSPGPSCVSMKSDRSMGIPWNFKDGNHQPTKKRRRQERADSPGPSCVSMKSDWSMDRPPQFKDGRPSREERSKMPDPPKRPVVPQWSKQRGKVRVVQAGRTGPDRSGGTRMNSESSWWWT